MRILISAFFLLVVVSCKSTNPDYLTLNLIVKHCERIDLGFVTKVRFFRNGNLIKETDSRGHFPASEMKIEHFQTGEYTVVYRNAFNQEISKRVVVEASSNTTADLLLCTDELAAYPNNTLLSFKNNDSLKIYFKSSGCFHFRNDTLVVYKNNNRFFAELTEEKQRFFVPMNDQMLKGFRRFENELIHIPKRGGCTTIDTYKVNSDYLNIEITDGTCNWDGFYFLKKSLFGDINNP